MYLIYVILGLFLVCNWTGQNSADSDCFRVAVYEHVRIDDPIDQPFKQLNNNFVIFKKVIEKASYENVKLIVLPEYGLVRQFNKALTLNKGLSPIVPPLNTNLCAIYQEKLKMLEKNKNLTKEEKHKKLGELESQETETIGENVSKNVAILRKFSCLAVEHDISIALNLNTMEKVEKDLNSAGQQTDLDKHTQNDNPDDYVLYNTNLVFGSNGKLIAKYRKFNLYEEPQATRPPQAEAVTFESKYGKFGLATCADILFEQPIKNLVEKEQIDHLIFSTHWYDPELPVITALNFHSATATKYGINIISANGRNLNSGTFGSGVYDAKTGVRIQSNFNHDYRLLIAELPIGDNKKSNKCRHTRREQVGPQVYKEYSYVLKANKNKKNYRRLQVPFEQFESVRLMNREDILSVCYNETCCQLEFKMNEDLNFESDEYHLIAFGGIRNSQDSNVSWYEEACALVLYNDKNKKYKLESSTRFDKFKLAAKFNSSDIYSNVLTSNLKIIPRINWSFKQQDNFAEILFEKIKVPIASATLYARNFALDPINRSNVN